MQTVTRTSYSVNCLRCGTIIQFGWAEGDPSLEANWVSLCKVLAKHGNLLKGHHLSVSIKSREYKLLKTNRIEGIP